MDIFESKYSKFVKSVWKKENKKSKYLRENLDFIEKEISTLKTTKHDYEESLQTLYLPFQGLYVLQQDNQRIGISKKQEFADSTKYDPQDFCNVLWSNKVCSLTILFLFLSILICYNRSLFLDLVIYSIYLAFVFLRKLNQRTLKLLIASLIVSLIIDMSWMIVFSEVFFKIYYDFYVFLK